MYNKNALQQNTNPQQRNNIREQNNGSVRELALPYTCAGGTSTYTTGFPAPQGYYTLFATKLQGESIALRGEFLLSIH